jgi:hypothetical protein
MDDKFFPCDPLKDFNFPQDLKTSILALGLMYIGFTIIAFITMKLVASKHN